MPGPVPKRASERRRRGSEYKLHEAVQVEGVVEYPSADESWHPMARDWFESLKESAQSKFYEPSDWSYAVVWTEVLSRQLSASRVSAHMMACWSSAATDLLTTEAARRRVRMEVNRRALSAVPEPSSNLDSYRDL
jgi:hypothetical protein